jgi:hypothetical protein|tara:strand:- start:3082 stop:3801 length:720 start_codon:yes stop_codon:yes gene_type:complete
MSYGSINPELLGLARENLAKAASEEKSAFVQAGDPMMDPMAGGGGGAPPMDPAMGGAPPGGPPMDPAMGGGAPPMDPMMGGAPPMDPMAALQPMIQQAVQAAMGGAGGDGGQIKPKIDVNIEIMQIKKILAKISDALGIQIPAADMVATPEDLTAMAQGNSAGAGAIEGGGASAISAPSPIEPMGAAMPGPAGGPPKQAAWEYGRSDNAMSDHLITEDFQSTANVASAWLSMQAAKGGR